MMETSRRAMRRHTQDMMKRRAARQMLRWSSRGKRDVWVKSSGSDGEKRYTAQEMGRNIGRLAAMHCTHVCGMCKHEKHFGLPHIKAGESVRVFSLESVV